MKTAPFWQNVGPLLAEWQDSHRVVFVRQLRPHDRPDPQVQSEQRSTPAISIGCSRERFLCCSMCGMLLWYVVIRCHVVMVCCYVMVCGCVMDCCFVKLWYVELVCCGNVTVCYYIIICCHVML